MQARGAVWPGEASYSIYMLRMPVFWIVKEVLMRADLVDRAAIAEAPRAVGGGLVLLCLAVLLPLAHLSHAWFETPARRTLSTLLAASLERRRAARARLQGAGSRAPQP